MTTQINQRRNRILARSVRRPALASPQAEPMEARQLLSASLASTGLLTVTGTSGVDAIVVSLTGGKIQVKQGASIVGAFTPTLVKSIVINGLGGNDALQVLDTVTAPAVINGGEGDDFLRGGGGKDTLNGDNGNDVLDGGLNADVFNGGAGTDTADYSGRTSGVNVSLDGVANDGAGLGTEKDNVKADVENVLGGAGADLLVGNLYANLLLGNAGNDKLIGGAGRDVLIGGKGFDTLQADADDDLLIGSSTLYDTKTPFLRTLGYEWRRTDLTYAQRIARLKSGASGVKIDSVNVPADVAADTSTGGLGQDWFVGHWGDVLKDKATTETATVLSSPIRFTAQARSVSANADQGDLLARQSKSASGFGAFSATAVANYAPPSTMEAAHGSASQISSLADTKITASLSAAASHFDAFPAQASSNFSTTFVIDEPRAFTFSYIRAFTPTGRGWMDVTLHKAGATSDIVHLAIDFEDFRTVSSVPSKAFVVTGTLGAGTYTMSAMVMVYSTSFTGGDAGSADGTLSATLTTKPYGT